MTFRPCTSTSLSAGRPSAAAALLLLLVAALLVVPPAAADAPRTGLVQGTVIDTEGAPLPGATVRLDGERGTESAACGADGRFRFAFVIPGRYTVRTDLAGFQGAAGEIVVSAGGSHAVDLVLASAVADEIVVNAETPLVNRYDVTGGGTLSNQVLDTVIGTSQDYRSWIAQLPGAHDDRESQRYSGFRPTIEGVEGTRQVYFVDGVDVSFVFESGGTNLVVPTTAVQELKVESTGAGAEYGRTVGSYVSVITKSGTNDPHGHLSYIPFNAGWAEEQELFPAVAPDEVHHNWEASLSGPLVRNRLWFYAMLKNARWPTAIVLGNGVDVVDLLGIQTMYLAKIDWRPSQRHTVTVNYLDTPQKFPWWNETVADLHGVAYFDPDGSDLVSLRWGWAVRDDLFLESHLATTHHDRGYGPYVEPDVDPACREDSPCGNGWRYQPLDGDRLWYNGPVTIESPGAAGYPRDQGNVSLDLFTGAHDIKAGLDVQRTAVSVSGVAPPYCRGYGYDPHAPGGFGLPIWCVYFPTRETWQQGYGPVEMKQESGALFVRDRFEAGRWAFNVGLRADRQHHVNDVGATVFDTTDVAPRLAASYDVRGDSRLLLTASAGRYVLHLPAAYSVPTTEGPLAEYDVYLWDWATWSGYDTFLDHVGAVDPQNVTPDRKDELAVGADWQFHSGWALRARAVYWERSAYSAVMWQVNDSGAAVGKSSNIPGARAERLALNLSVQRRFADGWTLLGAYTWSNTEGNCDLDISTGCGGLGDHEQFVNPEGVPYSRVNRWGKLATDRTHDLKVSGSYLLGLGRGHGLDLNAHAFYLSGQPWQLTAPRVEPLTQQEVIEFLEPRGSHRNPSQYQINLGIGWSFPVAGQVGGQILVEILNVTNEQELIGVLGREVDGAPTPTTLNYQLPRWYRIVATVRF